ncbi:MAG TPA: glycosyltransferase family 2 protein [Coriobacteriia bacterium]
MSDAHLDAAPDAQAARPDAESSGGAKPRGLLSVVVPVYLEQEVLPQAYRRLKAALDALAPELDHEIVFVDDGSTDGSSEILRSLAASDSRVRVVRFARNFGHQMAVTAGLDVAAGDAVVVIDADMQDPPEVIERMVAEWRKGYAVVYGRRVRRQGESSFKLLTAKVFYRGLQRLSETELPVDAGDFRLLDRRVVDVLVGMRERGRYMRGMVSWVGFPQNAVEYERQPRAAGKTKYSLRKMVRLALDGVTSFSSRPLMLAAQIGGAATVAGFLLGLWVVVSRLTHPETTSSGWASMIVVVIFMGGVQLMSVGLLGAYLAQVFDEVKGRPLYVVEERLGFDRSSPPPTDAR